jgi:hypothetical protein
MSNHDLVEAERLLALLTNRPLSDEDRQLYEETLGCVRPSEEELTEKLISLARELDRHLRLATSPSAQELREWDAALNTAIDGFKFLGKYTDYSEGREHGNAPATSRVQ